ncbi:C40 family peptidase [Streptacidiphilus rugosus]|uniref:C40 family peptidase n=1 Tax=Streptacidiphilus rugosus TaxID=405783 RepID=UPI0005695855|nr:C40 family peptidase [Streptacidiphilus rugosus]
MTAFAELDISDCTCAPCRAHGRAASPTASEPRHHTRPLVRAAATTAMLAVGGGAALMTAPTANAEPAPAHAGWDGHRYWFKSDGQWRWTTHYDVYLRHAGSGDSGTTTGAIRQGWDGQRYWFRKNGEWRWTTHYDIYLTYVGGGSGSTQTAGGITWGWDGQRYWFRKNGEWRWTTHYDIYLRYAGASHPNPGPGPGDPGSGKPPTPPPGQGVGTLESAISFAEAQLGKPYVWGGNGPYGYDCSGLVQQAYYRADVRLPRVAADQYRATTPIAASQLRRGDLIFWSSSSRASGIHHVAIYLGSGRYIEAPHPGADVRISVLSTGYYPTQFGRVS